ncbi:MAG: acyl-CoA reductase-like NAD-dependent aldehyde dehydrogenase [Gammaproteobacteria bacterium]|jgi:acyl-CoA reductase-like NAD-dependent aldehyde dehydrogenase
MHDTLQCLSPVDDSIYVQRPLATGADIRAALQEAVIAQRDWAHVAIDERQRVLSAAIDHFMQHTAPIAEEISWQMGRPISQAPSEMVGFEERARHMIAIAPQALADIEPSPQVGFERFIRRDPLGLVFVIAPWNYPYLTAVNSVIPALMAGNAVLLKHSAQTPLCAERFAQAFASAGLPTGLFHALHMDHQAALAMVGDSRVDFVAFTGAVEGGRAVQRAAAQRFITTGLELGGKDPAYIRADADLEHAAEHVMDGVFFNSGQSCCGIERIYVHHSVYEEFVARSAAIAASYRLGNPLDPSTNLGPMVRSSAATFVRGQIREAIEGGARALIDETQFSASVEGSPYLAPQLLVDVHHAMRVMHEESFGPVAGIIRVSDDNEAVVGMNDSNFGLSASVWTRDVEAARALGARVQAGTFFMNRCDYLDPALAWTAVKDSGRGCTLSSLGYAQLTRAKSFHLRLLGS